MSAEIVPYERYDIATVDAHEIQSIVAENLGATPMGQSLLPKIKIPSGETSFITIPSIDGEQAVKSFQIVLLYFNDGRAFWEKSLEETGGGEPPDCFSDDGLRGQGYPGGTCAVCPKSKFPPKGSDVRRPPCKQMKFLYGLLPNMIMPVRINVPPTSLANYSQFASGLINMRKRYYEVIVNVELVPGKASARVKHWVWKFTRAGVIPDEGLKSLAVIRESMKAVFQRDSATAEDFRHDEESGGGASSGGTARDGGAVDPDAEPVDMTMGEGEDPLK